MKRVVVTGLGIVSSIGNNAVEVTRSLKEGKSGIEFVPQYKELGFRSQVAGTIKMNVDELVDRRLRRFMGDGAAYAYLAMKEAIADAGLGEAEISNERTGLVAGSGGPTTGAIVQSAIVAKEKGPKRVGPFMVPRAMCSTVSANLATAYKIKGLSYSISSACSTSAHCIGNAVECIQLGKADRMFAGGGEELDWTLSVLFDAMGAMSSKYNDTPERASRAYDKDRDGFVISGGGGMLVLEELELARARGAKIYAEVIGYGATSDGADMVAPSGEGAVRCMKLALDGFSGAARRNARVHHPDRSHGVHHGHPIHDCAAGHGHVRGHRAPGDHQAGTWPVGDPPKRRVLRWVAAHEFPQGGVQAGWAGCACGHDRWHGILDARRAVRVLEALPINAGRGGWAWQ